MVEADDTFTGAWPVPVRPGRHPGGGLRNASQAGPPLRHLAAARYFESLDDAELPGLLATHYLAAHQSTPEGPDAEALAGQARVIALRAAADRAASLGSQDQALAYLREALEITGCRLSGPGSRCALGKRPATGVDTRMRWPCSSPAVQAYLADGHRPLAASALAGVSRPLIFLGRPAEAATRIETSLEAVAATDDEGHARLFAELARSYMLDWRPYEVIIGACDRALAIAERLDLVSVITYGPDHEGHGPDEGSRARRAWPSSSVPWPWRNRRDDVHAPAPGSQQHRRLRRGRRSRRQASTTATRRRLGAASGLERYRRELRDGRRLEHFNAGRSARCPGRPREPSIRTASVPSSARRSTPAARA